jgi:hypothetical protein
MTLRPKRWHVVLALLALVVGLAVLGAWMRRGDRGRCALDGVRIEPRYRVRVVDAEGTGREFCCVRCARRWLEDQKAAPRAVYVTDEASGQEVEADRAFFVRSAVVTTPTSGNRVHAFARRGDAEHHAAAAHGRLLDGSDRPFSED